MRSFSKTIVVALLASAVAVLAGCPPFCEDDCCEDDCYNGCYFDDCYDYYCDYDGCYECDCDGCWSVDRENSAYTINPFGSTNSIARVA